MSTNKRTYLLPNRKVESVSSILKACGEHVKTRDVLAFPPRESCNVIFVSIRTQKGLTYLENKRQFAVAIRNVSLFRYSVDAITESAQRLINFLGLQSAC
jgi:2'-5' RNA ligase